MTMYNIIGPISLSALSVGTYTHIGCGVGRVTDTAAGGTHNSVPGRAEIGLKSPTTSGDHVCREDAAPFVVGRKWLF